MTAYAPMPDTLTTERLLLRPLEPADAEWLVELETERGDGAPELDTVRERLAARVVALAETGFGLLSLRRRDEGDCIGYCGLIRGRSTVEEPEIGYELFRHAHGRGYATEAARAVVEATAATGRTRMWATIRPWNAPSFRVAEKLAFTRSHTTEDEKGEIVWLRRELP